MTDINPTTSKIVTEVEDFLHDFRNPQTDVDMLTNLLAAFAAIGILQAPLYGWLQGVLAAAGALILAVAQRPVTAKLARRAAKRAARRK